MTITVEGKIANIPDLLMEEMREAAMEAFRRTAPVGEEIAGLLFGARSDAGWTVTAWRPIPREDGSRAAVPLTESEEEAAGEILWEYKTDPQLHGADPVGWIRSRTRGMAALSPEDAEVCRHFFGDQGSLAVILRPTTQRPLTAALFHVAAGTPVRESSCRGVEMAILPKEHFETPAADVSEPAVPVAAAPESSGPEEVAVLRNFEPARPAARKRRVLLIAGALGGTLATVLGCFLFLDRPLSLDAEIRRSQVVLTWNRQVGFMTGATGAELDVAGDARELTEAELRAGRVSVSVPSGDFKVSLRLRGPYADGQQAVLTLIRQPGYRPDQ